MSTRTSHGNEAALFYITFTCYQWLPLFELSNGYDLVYKWFEYLKEKYGRKTTAYMIMPNHIHCILFFPRKDYDLNKVVGNGKRFMAYELIKRLEEKGLSKILLQLKEGLTHRDVAKGQKHKVFENSFDAKPIYHRKFLLQKINYIHQNCVWGKWKLVEHWEDYEHSSARYYVKNKLDAFLPVHYEELS
jgi:REP element-mobilizing transposase RayT